MVAALPGSPLLSVKRMIPQVRTEAVRRTRLEERLESASRLTLVVAPAGWGKTSLLSRWAAGRPGARVAWVSLDESDDEPVQFWSYVLTSLHETSDDVSPAALEALPSSGDGPMSHALPILLNELSASPVEHVLVLDDYHVITRPEVHEGVEFLLGHLPPSLRLVIVSRVDPLLPLARMRVRGDLVELRATDLRFSPDESAAMVSAVASTTLDASTVDGLWRRTEGWAAGLQLAALALRGGSGDGFLRTDDRHLFDYFEQEVLPGLAPAARDLLRRTAPLELLSGPLCDAALDTQGSAEVLAELERADLFVVALDQDDQWYRCHRLLRDAVRRGGSGDDAGVLRRAARWFEDEGRMDDAVRHLVEAGDLDEAGRLMTRSFGWFLNHGWSSSYLALGARLREDGVDPQLALCLAYAADRSADRAGVTHWMDVAERGIDDGTSMSRWSSGRAGLWALRAAMDTPADDPEVAVELAERASALEAASGDGGRADADAALGLAYGLAGRFDEAVEILTASWRGRARTDWTVERGLSVANYLALFLLAQGDDVALDRLLDESRVLVDDAIQEWGPSSAAHVVTLLRLAEGRRAYQRRDLVTATAQVQEGLALAEVPARPTYVVVGLVFSADLQLASGHRDEARATLGRAREIVDNEPITPFVRGWLEDAETRVGRAATRDAARSGALYEELTDRELSILRMLPGTATQREIGAAMFLSMNTVKAYNKSLYRKLGVGSRQDAVRAARGLGLI